MDAKLNEIVDAEWMKWSWYQVGKSFESEVVDESTNAFNARFLDQIKMKCVHLNIEWLRLEKIGNFPMIKNDL